MLRKLTILIAAALFLLSSPAVLASDDTGHLLNEAWPNARAATIGEIGRGIGVVFSPDLSVPENCRFFQALGFACFQGTDWTRILEEIHQHNEQDPERRIYTLVLETHGTNGNGLKLQTSYSPTAERSYISVGALQERLAPEGIAYVIISACNSQRLLRPYIYSQLDPYNGDKLFLPATCGIVNASFGFDPARSPVTIITPQSSHIETTLVGSLRELAPPTRQLVLHSARALGIALPPHFAISDIMMQIITRDPRLKLATDEFIERLSPEIQPIDRSEQLYRRFLTYLNAVATREKMTLRQARTAERPATPRRLVR